VHPLTLHRLNQIIRRVGGDVTIYNPLRPETKAQVCQRALQAGLTSDDLARTLSCSRASSSQRGGCVHCGFCWACLVRRSALTLAVPGGDPTGTYRVDPWSAGSSSKDNEGHDEFMAVLYWLDQPFTRRTLAADLPLPTDVSVAEIMDVIEGGRTDLRHGLGALVTADSPYRERLRTKPFFTDIRDAA
jgi:hypothetical protein